MKKPPCIRGLAAFKKGCPQRAWNGEDGCPAFIEAEFAVKGGTEKVKVKECVDMHMARLQFHTNCLLEGSQQSIESFRNGMVEKDASGKMRPRPSQIEMAIAHTVQRMTVATVSERALNAKRIDQQ
jgi:hypothetical protein